MSVIVGCISGIWSEWENPVLGIAKDCKTNPCYRDSNNRNQYNPEPCLRQGKSPRNEQRGNCNNRPNGHECIPKRFHGFLLLI